MYRGEYNASRLRNWLALLLMAVATFAAGRTQAADRTDPSARPPISSEI